MLKKRRRIIVDKEQWEIDEQNGAPLSQLVHELHSETDQAVQSETDQKTAAAAYAKASERIGDIKALCNSVLLCPSCGNKATDLVRCCEAGRSEMDRGSSCVVCASCFRDNKHIQPPSPSLLGYRSLRQLCRICPLKRQRQAESGAEDLLPRKQQRFAVTEKVSAPLFDTVSEVLRLAEAAAKDAKNAEESEKARASREERAAAELARSRKRELQLNLQLTEAVRRTGGGEGMSTLEELEAELDSEVFARTCEATQRAMKRAVEKQARFKASARAELEEQRAKVRRVEHEFARVQAALEEERVAHRVHNQQLDQATRETLCSVCLAEKKNTVLLPCFHLASCSTCAARCAHRCPICRVDCTGSMRVFVA